MAQIHSLPNTGGISSGTLSGTSSGTSRYAGSNVQSLPKKPVLTRREREVLIMIGQGGTSQAIAKDLFVSKRTVDFHLANCFTKLGVNNRISAWRKAVNLGYINLRESGYDTDAAH